MTRAPRPGLTTWRVLVDDHRGDGVAAASDAYAHLRPPTTDVSLADARGSTRDGDQSFLAVFLKSGFINDAAPAPETVGAADARLPALRRPRGEPDVHARAASLWYHGGRLFLDKVARQLGVGGWGGA